ncbi:MAG TPA: alpha/beta family hydrolase [Myxococcales bacterium]|nr:alpha/beta family hydrolase [Myxococcales bacterium]
MILQRPPGASCLYVLAHGAGAGMRHPFLQHLADALAGQGVATLRYDFPYMEQGRRRIDPAPVLHARVREAVAAGAAQGLPLFAGGKSLGGRMTSQAQALEPLAFVRGLCLVGFPLHPAGNPGVERASHLREVALPMLFLQGTRDELAHLDLLKPVLQALPRAALHVVDDADHSFHVRKKSGRIDEQVVLELAQAFARWAHAIIGGGPPR